MPEYAGTVTQIPVAKQGNWKKLLPKWRTDLADEKGNPKYHVYTEVSSSTASNLCRDYGVEAETHTIDDVVTMFVRYPSKRVNEKGETVDKGGKLVVDEDAVAAIKAQYKANQAKANSAG